MIILLSKFKTEALEILIYDKLIILSDKYIIIYIILLLLLTFILCTHINTGTSFRTRYNIFTEVFHF